MSQDDIDISAIIRSESIYSIASFASYRLHSELIDILNADEIVIDYAAISITYVQGTGDLVRQFEKKLVNPLLFLSDLFMEIHRITSGSVRSSTAIGKLSESRIEILTEISANIAVSELRNSPIAAANTLPFRCLEEYDSCKSSRNWCTAALVVCMLQCIVPLARGAGATSSQQESQDEDDS
ncbi:hypothetical protein D3C78_1203520 [compost metagenome]